MAKSTTMKGLSILLALALLCSMGLMALVLSSPSTAGAQPWSMYFAQTYVMEDGDGYDQVWVSIMHEDQSVTDVQLTNEDEGEVVQGPSIAIAPNGNIIVAWEYSGGANHQIHYAVLNGAGTVIKGETALTSSGSKTGNYDPCVAVTPDGKVFIVWKHSPAVGNDPVRFAVLNTAGNILTTQTDLTGSGANDPTVGTSTKDATNNNVVIAWEENDDDEQVWFTILNSSGGTVVASTQVTSSGVDSREVNVAVLPGGNFAIVWEESDGSKEQIWFTIRSGDGSMVKGNTKLTTSGVSSDEPSVAATPGGNIVIIWTEDGEDIFYAILNGSGNVVKAIAQAGGLPDTDNHPDVAIEQDGDTVISWENWAGTDQVVYTILGADGAIVVVNQDLTNGTYDVDLDGEEGRRQVATKPTPLRPVGGEAFSPDKMSVVAPWITLAIAITVGTGMLVRRRRTAS